MNTRYSIFFSLFNLSLIFGFVSFSFKKAYAFEKTHDLAPSGLVDWNTTINFNSISVSLNGLTYSTGGLTFTQASPTAGSQTAVLSYSNYFLITDGPDPEGTDRGFLYNIDNDGGAITSVGSIDFRFKSTDATEFKLQSMEADMGIFTSVAGYGFTVTITGYRDGIPVANDNIDFTSSDASGSVSYAKNSNANSNGGVLTFNTDWQNVDEVRFTGGNNSTIRTLMLDDIALSPAVTDNLPVTLVNFNATNLNDQPELSWKTSLEANFSHFEIEKSAEGKSFIYIGSVTPNGTEIYQYFPFQYEDKAYYRLKMIDLDGSFEYSRMASISLKGSTAPAVAYPVPAQKYISVKSPSVGIFVVYDTNGRKVLETTIKPGENKIEIHNLPKGIYLGFSGRQRLKFVKD